MRKSILSIVLITILLCSGIMPTVQAAGKLDSLKVGEVEFIGHPAMVSTLFGTGFGFNEKGENLLFASLQGNPAPFVVWNLDTWQMEDILYLDTICNGVDVSPVDGRVYIATNSSFYIYDPITKKLGAYGRHGEKAIMERGGFDEAGNYYFGSYPNAILFRYNIKKDIIEIMGSNMLPGNYIRGMAVCGNEVYMGGMGEETQIAVFNTRTKRTKVIPMPEDEELITEPPHSVYAMSSLGRYFTAKIAFNQYYTGVYDTQEKEWIGVVESACHLHWAGPEKNEKGEDLLFYGTNEGCIHSFNTVTGEIKAYDGLSTIGYVTKPAILTLKDQEKYPGKSIVFGAAQHGFAIGNFEKNTIEYFTPDEFPSMPTNLAKINNGYNNDIVCGIHQGSDMVIYDVKERKVRAKHTCSQIEGHAVFDGKYYLGMYGHARLQELEPYSETGAVVLGHMGDEHQDRSFNITDAGDKIVWGAIPYYGYLGGCIGIYDKKTGDYQVVKDAVKDQSITGLTYFDGKVYGCTGIYGGLGVVPVDAPAHLFRMDVQTGEVELSVPVSFQSEKATQYYLGKMAVSEDGRLFVGSNNILAEVNPENLSIKKEWKLASNPNLEVGNGNMTYWEANYMKFTDNGLLLTNIGSSLTALDIETGKTKNLYNEYAVHGFLIGGDDQIYMKTGEDGGAIYRLNIEGISGTRDRVISKRSIILKADHSKALYYGDFKVIDEQNDQVAPREIDGRTLVPVRFLAQNFGAQVGWDEATQTVTVSFDEKTASIRIGEKSMTLDGEEIPLDTEAITIEARTMLPLRAFVENVLEKTVYYDDQTGLIVLSDESLITNSDSDDLEILNDKIKQKQG